MNMCRCNLRVKNCEGSWSESSEWWRLSNPFSFLFMCVWPFTYLAHTNILTAIKHQTSFLQQKAKHTRGAGGEADGHSSVTEVTWWKERDTGGLAEGGLKGTAKSSRWIYKTWKEETDGWKRLKDLQMDGSRMHLWAYMEDTCTATVHTDAFLPVTNPLMASLVQWIN